VGFRHVSLMAWSWLWGLCQIQPQAVSQLV
jgi:hypothetical protein